MLDPVFLAFAIPAVLFAGVSKGGFGSGAAFAATPILALVVEPAIALALMLPLLMLMDVAALRAFWRGWHAPSARVLVLGAVPGIVLGAALYDLAPPDLFRLLIGVLAVGFVTFQAVLRLGWLRPRKTEFDARKGLTAGAVAGFTSFISHAGGPPVAVFLLAQPLRKTVYQATTVIVFWAINLLKVLPFAFLGFFTAETLTASLVLAPVAFLGVWLGVWLHHRMPEWHFFALTYVLLTLTGAKLIWDATLGG